MDALNVTIAMTTINAGYFEYLRNVSRRRKLLFFGRV